ncbi:Trehalose transport system permease protein SugB [archaeon HR06]|nr:Trehalose transport system permease protein SugB [archaeon HR06]
MIPPIVGIIPLFIVFKTLGLNDTFQGLILAYTSFNLPFTVWILRGFFLELPKEIEEAALIDGATYFNILRKIVVPLSFPAIITTATLSLIQSWNEFIFAVFLTSQEIKTIPILIASFIGDQQYFWNELTAASVIALIPVFILVLLVQKQLIRGLTFGVVKG